MIHANRDLPDRIAALIGSKSIDWVMEGQPVRWQPDRWTAHWQEHSLPDLSVLIELEFEFRQHQTIRRKFLFETYQDRAAMKLLTAVMAWGLGLSNYGPTRAGRILSQDHADKAIEAVVSATRQAAATAGYGAYYTKGNTLKVLDVSFITKLIPLRGLRVPAPAQAPHLRQTRSRPPSPGCPLRRCSRTSKTRSPPSLTSAIANGPRTRQRNTKPNQP